LPFPKSQKTKKKTLIEDEKIYEVYQEPITPSPPPPKPEPLTQIPPRDLQLLQNPNVSTWRKNKIRKKYIGE
jgi:hypothetical protein